MQQGRGLAGEDLLSKALWNRSAREAGARVSTNVMIRDLDIAGSNTDARRLEVVAEDDGHARLRLSCNLWHIARLRVHLASFGRAQRWRGTGGGAVCWRVRRPKRLQFRCWRGGATPVRRASCLQFRRCWETRGVRCER